MLAFRAERTVSFGYDTTAQLLLHVCSNGRNDKTRIDGRPLRGVL